MISSTGDALEYYQKSIWSSNSLFFFLNSMMISIGNALEYYEKSISSRICHFFCLYSISSSMGDTLEYYLKYISFSNYFSKEKKSFKLYQRKFNSTLQVICLTLLKHTF